jgi:DUF1707 SHOCT-like domain
VAAEPGAQMAAAADGHGRLRVSHADREQVIDALKAAFVPGLLTKSEFDARVGQALTSRTYAELAAVTAAIPAGSAAAQPLRPPARAQARVSLNKAVTGGACVAMAANLGMLGALCAGSGMAIILVAVLTVIGTVAALAALIVAS